MYLIDFETTGNGTALHRGDYVQDEWRQDIGLSMKAFGLRGGYTPDFKPRIFDTSNPGTNNEEGDPDLGSPHNKCGGPGRGKAGQPGQPGENCVPQGNVLIIQESNKVAPDDNLGGGSLCFEFDTPTSILSLGTMDISEEGDYMHITYDDGDMETVDVTGFGNGAVQTFPVNKNNIIRFCFQFKSSGALTNIAVCLDDLPESPTTSPAPSTSAIPTTACNDFVAIDFETTGNGTKLHKGDYVQNEWLEAALFTIHAESTLLGYTPGGKARIFDTGNPGQTQLTGDPDLGSPHRLCPGGGPGRGKGGQPSQPGANCIPQGNVLIIQEEDKIYPDDNRGGGTICFDFVKPIGFETIGLMDFPANRNDILAVKQANGRITPIQVVGAGNGGVFSMDVELNDVVQVCLYLAGEGAITNLGICLDQAPSSSPTNIPSQSPSISQIELSPSTSSQPSALPSKQPSSSAIQSGAPTSFVDSSDVPSLSPTGLDGPAMSPIEAPQGVSPTVGSQPSMRPVVEVTPPVTGNTESPSGTPSHSVTPSDSPSQHPTRFCSDTAFIDFEKRGDGTSLTRGDYVGDDWSTTHGFVVSALATCGGYTPDSKARIFDTSAPGTTNLDGDPDLGSPNK